MEDVGIFQGHLVYFVAVWYFMVIQTFVFALVCCTKKNLASLNPTSNMFCP
jgi:hypothetical protein